MSATTHAATQDGSLRDQLVASVEADAARAAALFSLIEDASLRNLPSCISDCEHALATLPARASARVPILKGLAHVLCFENQFAQAASHLHEAIALATSLGRAQDAAALRLTLVQPLERLGKVREAEQSARDALAAFEQCSDSAGMGRALVNLGVVRRVQGDATDALTCFERAKPLLAGNSLALGTLSTNRAEALLDLDRFDDAQHAFEHACECFASKGHTLGLAIATANLADVHARAGKVDEAVLAFERARLAFAACESASDAARLLAEEADAYASVGAFHRAARLYRQALPDLEKEGLSLERRRASLGLARAMQRTGLHDAALRMIRHEQSLLQEDAGSVQAGDVALALLEATVDAGDHAAAQELAPHVIHQLAARPVQQARALLCSLLSAARAGDSARAAALLDAAARLPEVLALPALRMRLAHGRALVAASQGHAQHAWSELTVAMREIERMRRGVRAEQLKSAVVAQSHQLAADAVAIALAGDPARLASRIFFTLESARANTLLEACAGRASQPQQEASTAPAESTTSSLSLLQSRLAGLYRRAEDGSAKLSEVHEAELALELALQRQASSTNRDESGTIDAQQPDTSADTTTDADIALLRATQRETPADCALLLFFREAQSISLLVITKQHATVVRHIWPIILVAAAARRLLLATDALNASTPQLPPQLRELADRLAAALAGLALPTLRSVALTSCQDVHALPLAHIVSTAAQCAAVQVPSVRVAAALSQRTARVHAPSPPRVLCVGVSDRQAPCMHDEAKLVAQQWPQAKLLLAEHATADSFLHQLPHHDLVHLSTHCVFDNEFPMSSRLRLADRWVAARELLTSLRDGCVVVLAGCESGQSSAMMGEDRYGLIRALLAGGASLVVASSWMLHDASAAWFFPRFHAALASRVAASPQSQTIAPPSLASCAVHALQDARNQASDAGLAWHRWQGVFAKGQFP